MRGSKKKTKKQKFYYLIKSKYLDDKFIKKTMKKRKVWEEYDLNNPQTEIIDFIHLGKTYSIDKNYWKLKSTLNGMVDLSGNNINMITKYNIVEFLKKLKNPKLNKMLQEQHKINMYLIFKDKIKIKKYKNLFKNNKVWIFKFIYEGGGKDIIILDSYEKFKNFVFKSIKNYKNSWRGLNYSKYNELSLIKKNKLHIEWVLQEYITNPMLYEDKKFHLRGYYLFHRISPNKKEGYILNNHRIYTARDSYKKGDYLNKDIHDSHFGSTSKYIDLIPDISDLIGTDKTAKLERDILYLLKHLLEATNTVCYKDDKSCFHLFGSDIMITDDYQIKFIEINGAVGFPDYNDSTISYNINYPHRIFEQTMTHIVDKQFPPKFEVQEKSGKKQSKNKTKTSSGKSSKKTKTKTKTATEQPQFIKL